jgi:hypothetical protein
MASVPKLASLKGLPALADWVLTANAPASRGHIAKWYIDIQSEYCLKSSRTPLLLPCPYLYIYLYIYICAYVHM